LKIGFGDSFPVPSNCLLGVKIKMKLVFPLVVSLSFFASAAGAPFKDSPPDRDQVKKLFAKEVHLEEAVKGRPLPTNDWWTSLLATSPFPGRMYAYPFTISADASAVKIWYPNEWNETGTEMIAGDPLLIEPIDPSPDPNPEERVLFDFESDWATLGWKIEGNAFGKSPMTNAQHGSRGFVGSRFAASFYGRDGSLGSATSPKFAIDKNYLHFKVAGGSDKSILGVHLLIDGESVLQEVGKNDNDFTWRKWDLRKYKGKKGQIRLRDESKGGWGFVSADHFVQSDKDSKPKSGPFSHASTLGWGDWHVAMRLHLSTFKNADVTFGRGMPCVWIEPNGLDLRIPGIVKPNGSLEYHGKTFGVHAPGGSLSAKDGFTLFSGPVLAISALGKDPTQAATFARHAAAIPRDTRFEWKHDRAGGRVDTTWEIKTSNGAPALQGWIPHHYRKTTHDFKAVGIEYGTRRGKMIVAQGNRFAISWPFTGIIPVFPLPKDGKFKPEVLSGLIDRWAKGMLAKKDKDRQGADTYWGGKSMLKTCQAFNMAWQLKLPLAKELYAEARRITADWLSYETGEKAFYYARYPLPWSGLVGFNSSYGSEQFTDNHFHYGYLAMSVALVGMHDPAWLAKYGPLAREVVKQYAEWERDSPLYPRLRTFECWAGHSYAGGMSSGYDGNNQESSSEAVGSWAGAFFLGAAMGDEDMMATGAMGYAIETEAVHEYWNNAYGWKNPGQSNWSPNYKPTICSVMRDRDMGAWTWFSGEPIHIYGIQWLPAWTHMNYFGAHKEHSVFQLNQMLTRQGKDKGKMTWEEIDGDWGQVTAAYAAFCQPEEICRVLDEAMEKKWRISSPKHAGIPYYLSHASRAYGLIDVESHTDLPTSVVLKKPDGSRTALVYNLSKSTVPVRIFVKGKEVLKGSLPAKVLMAVPLK
tara:strand:- start:48 stop:2810 length:2763 start_codon:yes stop_codon:yes gene_type:complete